MGLTGAKKRFLRRHQRRHVFRVYRGIFRFGMGPLYVSPTVIDFIYRPELAPTWLIFRLVVLALCFASFEIMKIRKFRDRYYIELALLPIVAANGFLTAMLAMDGGPESLYAQTYIIPCVVGIFLFNLTRWQALVCALLSYIPATTVMVIVGGEEHWVTTLVHSFYIWVMALVSFLVRTGLDPVGDSWANAKQYYDRQRNLINRYSQHEDIVRGVVHDVKSPLMAFETLVEEEHDLERKKFMELVLSRFRGLVKELTNRQKDSRDTIKEKVALHRIVNQMITETENRERGKRTINVKPNISPVWVNGNEDDWSRVVANLLMNACEAIPSDREGEIGVTLKSVEGRTQLEVRDNGTGLPRNMDADGLFVKGATFGKLQGSGLGLAFVREKVEGLGGEVCIENLTSSAGARVLILV